MRFATLGLILLVALLVQVGYFGQTVDAGGKTRLRAFLSTPDVDPFALNVADFRQRSDRTRFSTKVHDLVELGTGRVIVKRASAASLPTIILEVPIAIVLDPLRGTGVGHLEIDSRRGDLVPAMAIGDTVEVWNAAGELVRTGTLERRTEVANVRDETRLRALLSTPDVDPFGLNVGDVRQSSNRTRFSTRVHDVAELGTGQVIVKRAAGASLSPAIILEAPISIVLDPLRGTGIGHLEMDSIRGDHVPPMAIGDTIEVWNALGELVRTGTLELRH